ncbi:transcriptional regulator, PadR family [Enterococcus faecalis 13-SD-W-01]|nr:transcriptional regulator, PadR family [Enterococcus faecalis 13-SD-W-01]
MNTLSYVLLSVLLASPKSGYELKQLITVFWEAHHSQIYTTLANLNEKGYVTIQETSDSTQKKVYELTSEGQEIVHEWIKKESPTPTQRDEFLAKIYAFATLDQATVHGLLFTREQQLTKVMEKNQAKLAALDYRSKEVFGRYAVIQRRILLCEQEIKWCQQVKMEMNHFFANGQPK